MKLCLLFLISIHLSFQRVENTWQTMRWTTAKLDELKNQVADVQDALDDCPAAEETEVGKALQV